MDIKKCRKRDKYTKITIEDHRGNKTEFQMFLVNGKTWAIASMKNCVNPATFCAKGNPDLFSLVSKGLAAFVKSGKSVYSKIPVSEYYDEEGEKYVLWDLVEKYHTPEECDNFAKFMFGQTSVCLNNGENGIFTWDYERWLKQGMGDSQKSHDWD